MERRVRAMYVFRILDLYLWYSHISLDGLQEHPRLGLTTDPYGSDFRSFLAARGLQLDTSNGVRLERIQRNATPGPANLPPPNVPQAAGPVTPVAVEPAPKVERASPKIEPATPKRPSPPTPDRDRPATEPRPQGHREPGLSGLSRTEDKLITHLRSESRSGHAALFDMLNEAQHREAAMRADNMNLRRSEDRLEAENRKLREELAGLKKKNEKGKGREL